MIHRPKFEDTGKAKTDNSELYTLTDDPLLALDTPVSVRNGKLR